MMHRNSVENAAATLKKQDVSKKTAFITVHALHGDDE